PVPDLWTAYSRAFNKELLGLAYVLLANGLYQRYLRSLRFNPLCRVGRTALSNYLLQSVLAALIFFGFGLGLHDQLSRWQLLPVVLGIWIMQIVLSTLWLQRFEF